MSFLIGGYEMSHGVDVKRNQGVMTPRVNADNLAAGSAWLEESIVPEGQRVPVVDVAANVGQWSRSLLETAEQCGRTHDIDLQAFEPVTYIFGKLPGSARQRSRMPPASRAIQSAWQGYAAYRATGSEWGFLHEGAIHRRLYSTRENLVETAHRMYARQAGLDRANLMKIDTEGQDLAVLNGTCNLLIKGPIAVAQLVHNGCWISERHSLHDAFHLLPPLGDRIGLLTPLGGLRAIRIGTPNLKRSSGTVRGLQQGHDRTADTCRMGNLG